MPNKRVSRSELLDLVGGRDPVAVVDGVVEALTEVYEFNRHRHNEDAGDDGQTFGFLVYRNGWAAIEERLSGVAGVHTSRPRNSLQISVESGKSLHVYRGGGDDDYNIDDFNPDTGTFTKRSLGASNTRQLSIFDIAESEDDTIARLSNLMIVHTGNPDVGLTGVWIGAPAQQHDATSPWVFVAQVFPLSETATASADEGATPPAPTPFSERSAPDVVLKPHRHSRESTPDAR